MNNNKPKFSFLISGFLNRIIREIFKWAAMAVLLNIAASLNPELPEKFPIIFGLANGAMRAANLILRWTMEFLYSIKGLHLFRFFGHWWGEFQENFKIFLNWVATTGKWW